MGKRPATFRTRKLSPTTPMVLHPTGCGRVGNRRNHTTNKGVGGRAFGKREHACVPCFPMLHPPPPFHTQQCLQVVHQTRQHNSLRQARITTAKTHNPTQHTQSTTPPTTRKHTKLYRHQHRPRGHTEQTGNNTPTFSTTTSGAPALQAADKSKHSHTNPNLPFNTQTTTSDSSTTTPNQCHPRNGTTHLGHYPSFATPLVLSTRLKGG